ncbi:ribonuclease HII [Sulfurimonas aquatica]|uniref:Ribonuclease n=1 Tax=Sulfurimonas aquatica TaxID=2672570 RepID=A0A975AYA1_9BACT|nr:ribonuclease HII [Sulfurimonas aquatica]QSZ40796.1 ribonuclease HII [Sulfurimonas aquatica]
MQKKLLCGIDEAGRGPIAGDLVVAGCIFYRNITIDGLNDSKKISEKKRYKLFKEISLSTISHIVVISPQDIDTKGISECMREALLEIKSMLYSDIYLFDGNTDFGVKGLETMVKADGKIPEVSAASILAKVTHDRNIIRDAKIYPEYGFENNKGYGTKAHIEMIKEFGYCPIHRRSFKLKALL